jgi:hypothetical protein
MKIKTNIKVGAVHTNHNQTTLRSLDVNARQTLGSKRTRLTMALLFMAVALAALTAAKASAVSTKAEIDVGFYGILQGDVPVGEIYVPERNPMATQYTEHWVLMSNYLYPNKNLTGLTTEIRALQNGGYESEADFFARAPFGPGSRYVRVDCTEFDRLPGR